jgi:hypothetical protein
MLEYTSYQELDLETMKQVIVTQELVSRTMDFYTVSQILDLPPNSISFVYAGYNHTNFIARMLLSHDTGFLLHHVGSRSATLEMTVPSPHEANLISAYHYYKELTGRDATVFSPLREEFGFPEFRVSNDCLLFNDHGLSKVVIQQLELQQAREQQRARELREAERLRARAVPFIGRVPAALIGKMPPRMPSFFGARRRVIKEAPATVPYVAVDAAQARTRPMSDDEMPASTPSDEEIESIMLALSPDAAPVRAEAAPVRAEEF